MKQYQSTTEGIWIELKPVQLSENQKILMISTDENKKESKKSLIDWIKSEREGQVDELKSTELTIFYESKKPEIKENDNYHLISVNLIEKGDTFIGILNYRINDEHKQIRF